MAPPCVDMRASAGVPALNRHDHQPAGPHLDGGAENLRLEGLRKDCLGPQTVRTDCRLSQKCRKQSQLLGAHGGPDAQQRLSGGTQSASRS